MLNTYTSAIPFGERILAVLVECTDCHGSGVIHVSADPAQVCLPWGEVPVPGDHDCRACLGLGAGLAREDDLDVVRVDVDEMLLQGGEAERRTARALYRRLLEANLPPIRGGRALEAWNVRLEKLVEVWEYMRTTPRSTVTFGTFAAELACHRLESDFWIAVRHAEPAYVLAWSNFLQGVCGTSEEQMAIKLMDDEG
jgi:hypothetical protein